MKLWKQSAGRDDRWVTLPSYRHLVVLESEGIILFNISNVSLSKCYSILHSSLKLFGHSSSRIASENWDPVQEAVSTSMPPCSAESMESHEHGVRSGWVCNRQLCMPTLICHAEAKRWGRASICPAETSRPPEWDGHVQAPCWELLRGSPHGQRLWVKLRYVEDEVGLADLRHRVVWRKRSANQGTFLTLWNYVRNFKCWRDTWSFMGRNFFVIEIKKKKGEGFAFGSMLFVYMMVFSQMTVLY